MKIGIIATNEMWGGSEELWIKTAEAAMKDGHEVYISLYNYNPIPNKIASLINQGAIAFVRKKEFLYQKRTLLKKIWDKATFNPPKLRIINEYDHFLNANPDIILINQGGTYNLILNEQLRELVLSLKKPYFLVSQFHYEYHNIIPSDLHLITKQIFDRASKIFFVSQGNLNIAKRHLYSHLNNAVVVRNPVNILNTEVVAYPKTNVIHFANIGRYTINYKGQDILFEVFSSEKWKSREWQLHLYGEGPDEKYLRELSKFYQLDSRIIFEGYVNDIRNVWANNHILLMPSIGEGTPLAMVEAMICGRPCVMTDVAGHREWVNEGINGFIAESPSVRYFDAALERAWNKRQDWYQMGLNAHETAIKQYDPHCGETILKYLHDHL